MRALSFILGSPPAVSEIDGIETFWARHRALAAREREPFDLALLGGFAADRLGYAFASGYQAALRALVPDLAPSRVVSLSVTERGGASPRAIESALSPIAGGGYRLDGSKRWCTLASGEGLLLVAARLGEDAAGRPQIRVARVSAGAPGVTVAPMPETPFVPEIPHASLRFEGVTLAEGDLLPGDGYARVVKPFRTVEDIFVHTALLGYLIGEARRLALPRSLVERLAAGALALHALASSDPRSPAVHVALGGLLRGQGALIGELDAAWAAAGSPSYARWERDRALLMVAENARGKRLERAWEKLAQSAGQGSGGSAGV
ncbi:MAG: acyl-CoA dehydrogenase family protein [Byssovorax sp.]